MTSDRDVLTHGATQLPELTPERMLTTWTVDAVTIVVVVVAAAAYLYGVRRLRVAGASWSTGRCVLWVLGLLVVLVATSSSVAVYDTTLFSAHAVQHMLLSLLAPVPLALAAPITLALRTLPKRPRRILVRLLHSRFSKVVAHPLTAYALFVVSPFVLYYSPLYEASLRNDLLHNLAHVHYVLGGFLLFAVILALDPLPHRMPFVFRIMMIIGLGPMHVVLGVPIMSGNEVFAEEWYQEVGRTWGPSLLSDQQAGGGLLWVFGDVVTIGFLAGLYTHWLRSDARDARRIDRQLDRLYGAAPRMPVPWSSAPTAATEPATAAVPEPRPPQRVPRRPIDGPASSSSDGGGR